MDTTKFCKVRCKYRCQERKKREKKKHAMSSPQIEYFRRHEGWLFFDIGSCVGLPLLIWKCQLNIVKLQFCPSFRSHLACIVEEKKHELIVAIHIKRGLDPECFTDYLLTSSFFHFFDNMALLSQLFTTIGFKSLMRTQR